MKRRQSTPLEFTTRSISLSSGRISYIEEGTGPAVLLLHGAPLTSLSFARVIHALRPHYRVIAPDLPGFGRSAAAAAFDGTLASYAGFVGEFCRALQLTRFYAYLNDSSGCIGLAGLADESGEVAGLIVADTVPLPLTGRYHLVRLFLKRVIDSAPVRRVNRQVNLLPWLAVTVAPFLKPFTPDERRTLLSQFDTPDKRDRAIHVLGQMGRDDAFMRRAAIRARECFAGTPVLLLSGQFDPMRLSGGIPVFKRMFPRHTVRIIPWEEHFPILASGAEVGRVVHEWIQSLASDATSKRVSICP